MSRSAEREPTGSDPGDRDLAGPPESFRAQPASGRRPASAGGGPAEPGGAGDQVPVHPAVTALVTSHLDRLDRARPGLVTGLYLTGSTALGDYRHGLSDVDFVALLSREPDHCDLTALADAHAHLDPVAEYDAVAAGGHGTRPIALDGVYLSRDRVSDPPDRGEPAPYSLDGIFYPNEPCFQLNPVVWLELRRYGIAVRGEPASTLGIPERTEWLRGWLRGNLAGYWAGARDRLAAATADRGTTELCPAYPVVWTALGPPRLTYTLDTGEVIAKTGAAGYAAALFPDSADLLDRCRRSRLGEDIRFTVADARATAELARAVIAMGTGPVGGRTR